LSCGFDYIKDVAALSPDSQPEANYTLVPNHGKYGIHQVDCFYE